MPTPEPASSESVASPPDERALAGAYASYGDAFAHSIVVLAMGEACWIEEAGGAFHLLVEPAALGAARDQIERYDRESTNWPPPPLVDSDAPQREGGIDAMAWVAVVIGTFWVQTKWPGVTDRLLLDTRAATANGEWWRLATALFLHADAAHLLSNVLGGALVFAATISTFGRLRGWMLTFVAAVAGNLAVALLNLHRAYRSLGASTAIFAALGLITGRALGVACRSQHPHRWRAMFTPLVAGVTVLALYGAGGVRVDVLAHVCGFVAGLALGTIAPPAPSPKADSSSASR